MHANRKKSWAKSSLVLAMLAAGQPAMAEYYYVLDGGAQDPNAVQYASADAACQTAYASDGPANNPFYPEYSVKAPYIGPTFVFQTANHVTYSCITFWLKKAGDPISNPETAHAIVRFGGDCKDGEAYNPANGACEKKDEELDRTEMGDASATVAGMCFVGDPINPSGGNVFEHEVDFADRDGVLTVERFYNSRSLEGWHLSVDSRVQFDRDGAAVTFMDGRTALFKRSGDIFTAEQGERGSLAYANGIWTYQSPDNTVLTFNPAGQFIGLRQASGRSYAASRSIIPPVTTVLTLTDDLGNAATLTYPNGRLGTLAVGNLTVAYGYDASSRLAQVTRTMSGRSTTRKYLYEDAVNPKSMTGVVDERGVRISSWTYDAQNRATSSSMPLSAGKVTVAYNNDGTVTVRNSLGQAVSYEYQLVNGGQRISAIHGTAVAGCPAANSTFTYTAGGQMATQINAVGEETAFAYDTRGRETSRTEARGTSDERVTTTSWDGMSFRPKTLTTSDRQISYSYDPQGRLLSTTTHSLKD